MSTSQYTYHPFHTIGAATALLWDTVALDGAGAWRSLGKVADAAVVVATEQVEKAVTVKGLTQPVAKRSRARRYSLTFRLLETASPFSLELLYGEGNPASAVLAAHTANVEVLKLFGSDWQELAHPFGIVSSPAPTVKSYDGATSYAASTDYVLDRERGLLRRVPGGAIGDGATVAVTYSYAAQTVQEVSLGDSADLEPYRKVKLLQLAADGDDPASWLQTGVEFEFYKVNVAGADSRWDFAADDFADGVAVTWDCLYDGAQAKVGVVRSSFGVLAEW